MKSLIPWRKKQDQMPAPRENEHPLDLLQHRMNRMFEDFFEDFGFPEFHGGLVPGGMRDEPRFEVSETDDEIRIKAELPGMDRDDVEILLDENVLTIRGEKREERQDRDKKRNVYVSEMTYGTFQRSIPLPSGIDRDKVAADFKRGVLTLRLPRTEDAASRRRRIEVRSD